MKTPSNNNTLPLALALTALALSSSIIQSAGADSFAITDPMKTVRSGHTATLLTNGQVLVAGGSPGYPNAYSSTELYNPTTGTWTEINAMNIARTTHTATLLTNGQVMVVGGRGNVNIVLSSAELYNPVTGTWTNTGAMTTARSDYTATLLNNGKVLIAGGYSGSYLSSAELYDPASGAWTPTPGAMHTGRSAHTATLLPNGKVLVTGGQGFVSPYNVYLSSAELYDPASGTWTTNNNLMHTTRAYHTAIVLKNGKVLVMGGQVDSTQYTSTAELYNPATGTWTDTGSSGAGFDDYHGCPATLLTDGQVLIAGGNYRNFSGGLSIFFSSAQLYNPTNGTWTTTTAVLNTARYVHTATLLANGKVLIAGGSATNGLLASAELYNPANGPASPIILSNPTKLPSGAFQFGFNYTPGVTFTALATTNASLSSSNWTLLGGVTEMSPGQFRFTDPQATNNPRRFYRIRSP